MRGALTSCRGQRDGQVRILKEINCGRGTHFLSRAQGGSSQDTEEKLSARGALTSCRGHRDGQVRTLKEIDCGRGTHFLSRAQGWSSQDTERNRLQEGHSPSVECTERRVKSG